METVSYESANTIEAILDEWSLQVRQVVAPVRSLPFHQILGGLRWILEGKDARRHIQQRFQIKGYTAEDVITEFEVLHDIVSRVLGPEELWSIRKIIFEGIREASREFLLKETSQSTELLSLAIEASDVGFFDLDIASDSVVWTAKEAELFGFPAHVLKPNTADVYNRIYPDDLEQLPIFMQDPPTEYDVEFRVVLPDNSLRWLQGIGKFTKNEKGEPVRLIGANMDITERKRIAQELQEEKTLKEKFANALTHDLKNPLAAARLQVEVGRSLSDDPVELQLHFDKMQMTLGRIESMIDNLLDASRYHGGTSIYMEMVLCDLVPTLESTVRDYQSGSRQIIFNSPARVEGLWNLEGLKRVFENLIINAIKYGEDYSPITVTVRKLDDHAEISFHNFGPGIAPDEKQLAFRMFGRTKSGESSGKVGWGIGLTIVKGIIDSHGGSVALESSELNGTTFKIILPYVGAHLGLS